MLKVNIFETGYQLFAHQKARKECFDKTASAAAAGSQARAVSSITNRCALVDDNPVSHEVIITPLPINKIESHTRIIDINTCCTIIDEFVPVGRIIVRSGPVLEVGVNLSTFRKIESQ